MTVDFDRVIVQLNNMIVQTVALDRPVLTIGRSTDTAIQLPHPRVSRHHAEIRRGAGATVIVDLGSANGIVVDGERLPAHQPLPLVPGKVVQIGPYTLSFHTPESPESPAADLSDQTVMDVHADLRIHIDAHRRHDQVEAITGTEFFKRLRDEKQRLRPKAPDPPENESP